MAAYSSSHKPKKRGRQKRKGKVKRSLVSRLGLGSFQTKNPAAFHDRKMQQKDIQKLLAG